MRLKPTLPPLSQPLPSWVGEIWSPFLVSDFSWTPSVDEVKSQTCSYHAEPFPKGKRWSPQTFLFLKVSWHLVEICFTLPTPRHPIINHCMSRAQRGAAIIWPNEIPFYHQNTSIFHVFSSSIYTVIFLIKWIVSVLFYGMFFLLITM